MLKIVCSPVHNHLLHFQEDVNEWKFETTQNLQRPFMQQLYDTSLNLYRDPYDVRAYVDLREQLHSHCNRVYNQTCEWQFSPPYNPRSHAGRRDGLSANAAIVYLCCADAQEFQDFLWSLKFLDLNFNNEYKYPVGGAARGGECGGVAETWSAQVLVFHENFGAAQFNMIRQISLSNITFHKVKLEIPRFLDLQQIPRWYKGFSLGFRNMIRFHAIELYDHPALQHFDYYWRLDSDSFILARYLALADIALFTPMLLKVVDGPHRVHEEQRLQVRIHSDDDGEGRLRRRLVGGARGVQEIAGHRV
eukprot:765500-Hanusia_phi.AAC.2